MCGIAALISTRATLQAADLVAMCDLMRHRGPDGEGYLAFGAGGARWWDGSKTPEAAESQVALGHRRLAIVDLSHAGAQPMADPSGRFWLSFNGEIYNHLELRAQLETLGHHFKTRCDTEVLIAAFTEWGAGCLPRLNGMFAFIMLDTVKRSLFAARDRFGVKPLYWWRAPNKTLAFASEIKAFTALPGWRARLHSQGAYDYLVWGLTDHTPRTMFRDVFPVPPGHYLELSGNFEADPKPQSWYRLPKTVGAPQSLDEASSRWRELFADAVRLRLQADTPVGTALSGGLDSSSIVCVTHQLRRDNTQARRAFSARSDVPGYDEGQFMDCVVAATGVEQSSTWPGPDELLRTVSDITWQMDEPFGSASVFAEWKVFETVGATDVRVTLDGHGGDETLAGYRDYAGPFLGNLFRQGRWLHLVREFHAYMANGNVSPRQLVEYFVDSAAPAAIAHLLKQLAGRTTATPSWIDSARLPHLARSPFERASNIRELADVHLRSTSLPMQLHWNDRNSMRFSVESRAPFLDYRLVEFAMSLDDDLKIKEGESKRILRRAMAGIVPQAVLQRRDKMGFVTAEEIWVRRYRPSQFAAAFENAVRASSGILTPAALEMGKAMLEGGVPYNNRFWRILNFGVWVSRFNVDVTA